MKLFAGLLFSGLSLVLLSCGCRAQSETQANNSVSAGSNGTNHTTTTPVVKPGINITTASRNGSQPTTLVPVPSKTTASTPKKTTTTTPTNITTTPANITTTTASTTIIKTNTMEASSKSSNVTIGTPKAPSSASTAAVTATAKAAADLSRSSRFHVGSFIGGITLTLGLLVIGYIGCRTYHSKRGVQYRTIDEHDAII